MPELRHEPSGERSIAMKVRELREMSDNELTARAGELVDEIFHLRLRRATSQLPNPMKLRETKRDLARVKTLLGERGRRASRSGGARV